LSVAADTFCLETAPSEPAPLAARLLHPIYGRAKERIVTMTANQIAYVALSLVVLGGVVFITSIAHA